MTYTQALTFVHSRMRFGSRPGLATIGELMNRLGNQHMNLKYVHVAGTNGKGSTTTTIAQILQEAGYKVGKYTSPFLHTFTERIEVNGEPIPEDTFAELTQRIVDVIDDTLCPTEFEVLTAVAFMYYDMVGCDYVVLEVGMGGNFDATNIIPAPKVAVITRIDLDHMQFLGDTVEAIAREKCGVIKQGCTTICYPQQPEGALEQIRTHCRGIGTQLIIPSMPENIISSYNGNSFTHSGSNFTTPLAGRHQAYNAVVAIEAVKALGLGISDSTIAAGMRGVHLHGRFELIQSDPIVIADCCHNENGITALKNSLAEYFPERRIIAVMAIFEDKDYVKCVSEIAQAADTFIATQTDAPRVLPCHKVAKIAEAYCSDVQRVADRHAAYKHALSLAQKDDVVVVCGSFTLLTQLF